MTTTAPTKPTNHAVASPSQRCRHMARSIAPACRSRSSISLHSFQELVVNTRVAKAIGDLRPINQGPSEPALRDNQHVTGPHLNIRRHIAALDEILQANTILLVAIGRSQNGRVIAIRKIGYSTNGNHHV